MKIEQQPKFQPITITLETEEEAGHLWDLILAGGHTPNQKAREFGISLSNWFSNIAQIGGGK